MKLPPPLRRPKFAQWRYDHGLTLRKTAELVEQTADRLTMKVRCSHERVRTLCLPLDDAERSAPDAHLAYVIEAMTNGAVTAFDFPPVKSEAA